MKNKSPYTGDCMTAENEIENAVVKGKNFCSDGNDRYADTENLLYALYHFNVEIGDSNHYRCTTFLVAMDSIEFTGKTVFHGDVYLMAPKITFCEGVEFKSAVFVPQNCNLAGEEISVIKKLNEKDFFQRMVETKSGMDFSIKVRKAINNILSEEALRASGCTFK